MRAGLWKGAGRRGRGTAIAGAKSPDVLQEIVGGVYTRIGGDMVDPTCAYSKVLSSLAEAVLDVRTAAWSLGCELSCAGEQ